MGDGRAVLRSSIREFLCSEAMHALGIPTTRALCVTGSALPVRRETWKPPPWSPGWRPASSASATSSTSPHGRTARCAAWPTRDRPLLPGLPQAPNPLLALLREVSLSTARLLAHWQAVGFCHGVMNTDNMSILGLTIDYGPFGFLDAFDPGHICNHTDDQGRYAFARQPRWPSGTCTRWPRPAAAAEGPRHPRPGRAGALSRRGLRPDAMLADARQAGPRRARDDDAPSTTCCA
jgi:hypothetical protein